VIIVLTVYHSKTWQTNIRSEGSSGCQNFNNNLKYKGCINLQFLFIDMLTFRLTPNDLCLSLDVATAKNLS